MPFRILNTRETEVKVKWIEPISTPVEQHNVLTYNRENKTPTERIKEIMSEINCDTLNSEEVNEIKAICTNLHDIFHLNGDRLTCTNIGTANIALKRDSTPKYTKPYRLPHTQKQDIQNEIEKMLRDEIIEPSRSPWSSPIQVVPKKKIP